MAPAPLHFVPAVIFAALAGGWLIVDLLPMVLTDIRNEQIASPGIERELIGIPQPVCPDLGPYARPNLGEIVFRDAEQTHQSLIAGPGERIARRDLVRNRV